jgi:phospho-N-acetylmuramoyl-pentapeptide-transferase
MLQILFENCFNSFFMMLLCPFILFVFCAPWFIRFSKIHWNPKAREDTPESHRAKDYTPTMGGLLIVGVALFMVFLIRSWSVSTISLACILIGFCGIGGWDDWNKIRYKKGISERNKFMGQVIVAMLAITLWWWYAQPSTVLYFPCFSGINIDLGPGLFILWAVWVIVCTVNAVNFTDGLDGLAALTLIPNFAVFGTIALWNGQVDVAFVAYALISSLLGFLWFNGYPAEIFMGDSGSLALGATLATIALMTKYELLIPLAGGIFVIEGISVAAQILYFKMTKKRLLKMAPLHHHLELHGWPETKITIRFFIATLLLCIITLFVFTCSIK